MRHQKHRENFRSIAPKEYFSATQNEINIHDCKCPKCGQRMLYLSGAQIHKDRSEQSQMYLVCEDCDMRGKVRRTCSGKSYFISTPADRETRRLRQEAHYYFNKLVYFNVFTGIDQTYIWLTTAMGYNYYSKYTQRHIGEFGAEFCKRAIKLCIEKLSETKDLHKHIVYPFDGIDSYSKNSPELMDIIRRMNGWTIQEKTEEPAV